MAAAAAAAPVWETDPRPPAAVAAAVLAAAAAAAVVADHRLHLRTRQLVLGESVPVLAAMVAERAAEEVKAEEPVEEAHLEQG